MWSTWNGWFNHLYFRVLLNLILPTSLVLLPSSLVSSFVEVWSTVFYGLLRPSRGVGVG